MLSCIFLVLFSFSLKSDICVVLCLFKKKNYTGFTINIFQKLQVLYPTFSFFNNKMNHSTDSIIALIWEFICNFQFELYPLLTMIVYTSKLVQYKYKKIYVGYPKSRLGSVGGTTNYCKQYFIEKKKSHIHNI